MKEITLSENRTLQTDNDRIGVSGEHNAVVLKFRFPEEIRGVPTGRFKKRIMFVNASGICKRFILSDNTCPLNIEITQGAWLEMQLELTYRDIRWLSCPKMFRFEPALDCIPGLKMRSNIEFDCAFLPPEIKDFTDAGLYVSEYIPKGTEYAAQPVSGERGADLDMYGVFSLPFCENLTKKGMPVFVHTPIGTEFPALEPDEILIELPVYSAFPPPDTEDWTERDIYIFIDSPIDEIIIDE